MGPVEVDEAYLDHRQSLYFLEAMAMYQQQEREEAETPHDECLTFLINVAFVAARAAYDVKHAKPRNARHQYKRSMRDVATVVQEALDYAGEWKRWELRGQKAAESPAVAPSASGDMAAVEGVDGVEESGPPSTHDVLSDPPTQTAVYSDPVLSDPPTQTGILSDPPNQTALLTEADADIPLPPHNRRPSDLEVLDAALASIRACGSLKRARTESPEPAVAGALMHESADNCPAKSDNTISLTPAAPPMAPPPINRERSTSKAPHGKPHNRPGRTKVRTPLPTFSTPGFGKIRPQPVARTG